MNDDAKLLGEIEYLLRQGATYEVAPNLGADVLDRIEAFLARFIAYPGEHARHAHVLWIAHTWLMDCWDHTPRLLFVSPEAGSGKTLALTVTGCLVPRPDHVGDLTPAALYHSIDEAMEDKGGRPTILYDELDTVFGNAEEGRIRDTRMRRLLDIGHDKNATIKRGFRRKGKVETVRFQIYTAMALAGKMDVFDVPPTVRTRSVAIHMQRRLPEEKVERWHRYDSKLEAEPIRDLLQMWVELIHEHADGYRPAIPEGIENRDADVWEPLIAVADIAGGRWPALARVATVATVATTGVSAMPSPGVQLLTTIQAIFTERAAARIFTQDLLADLRMRGFTWAAPSRGSEMKLAQLLSGYKITPKRLRIGTNTVRGYSRDQFEDAWRRYLPPQVATVATVATDEESNDE
jgi:hypothetical protein